jgi:hypothetical protein
LRPRLTTGLPFSQRPLEKMRLLSPINADKNEAVKSGGENLQRFTSYWASPLLGYFEFYVRLLVPRSTLQSLTTRRDTRPSGRMEVISRPNRSSTRAGSLVSLLGRGAGPGLGGFPRMFYTGSPVSENNSSETVWKIRMGFTLGSHEALKRGEKPLYCHFCATKNTRFRPLQLFSKQFL